MNEQYWGRKVVLGAVAALALSRAVGCSGGFSADGCKAARTCATAGGESASDGGAPSGEQPSHGGTDAVTAAGRPSEVTPGVGGDSPIGTAGDPGFAGGTGGASVACRVAQDCSDAEPNNGEEVCDNGACLPGNPPPLITAWTPQSDAEDVEPDVAVSVEFSEPLDPKTVTSSTIQVLDGKTVVPGKLAYAPGKLTVTFTPDSPWALLAPYTLSVTTGVTDEAGAALVEGLSAKFSIRDGAWKAIDAVKDKLANLSDALPISSTGNVLLAWSGTAGSYCPVSARWFLRGEAHTATKTFPVAGQTECNSVSSGGNAAGIGSVVWNEPDAANGSDVQQYRADAWQSTPSRVSKNTNAYYFRLAIAASGVETFFEHQAGGTSKAWITNATGQWPAQGDTISTYRAQSRTSVAFDAKGNGLAVWAAEDVAGTKLQRIAVSRFTVASGKWATASDLPGSVATTTSVALQRGTPVVAVDSQGDAMALWVTAASGGKLMASRFVQATGWADPESISGALAVEALRDPPSLVFDGQAFVAAWTAQDAGKHYAYTARYALKTGWGAYDKQQTTVADGTSAARMPRLTSDGRGNLMLVFAKGSAPTYTLMYQRYTSGAWGAITPLVVGTGGTVTDKNFESGDILPLSMNSSGLAALSWVNRDESNYITGIRLASFY